MGSAYAAAATRRTFSATSGTISSAYYPKEERSFGDVLVRMGTQCAYDAMFNMLKEFYPDIRDRLRHKPRAAKP